MLRPWHEAAVGLVPGIDLFDAHTHTGTNDPDGNSCSAEKLIEGLELAGARAVVFTMHEPDGYPRANDRIIEEAAASNGRLVPFCRLDPAMIRSARPSARSARRARDQSSTRAPSSSGSTTNGSSRCSRSPTSAGCP